MKHILTAITLIALLPTMGLARKHTYQWQNGTLLKEHRSDTLAGFSGSASSGNVGDSIETSGSSRAVYYVYEVYVIRGNDGIQYTASQRLRWRWSHRADLIVNDSVEYRVAGRTLFLKGSNDKPYKCHIMERERVSGQVQSAKPNQ